MAGDRARLGRELDRLKALGVTNLRILGAGEKSPAKVAIDPTFRGPGEDYDQDLLKGLDVVLARDGPARHEGGDLRQQLLGLVGRHAGLSALDRQRRMVPAGRPGPPWPEFADYSARFYGDAKAQALFQHYLRALVGRVSSVTRQPYRDDPTIMAWQLANEPRPGGSDAFGVPNLPTYYRWVAETSALIKSLDPNHLVSTGSEGAMGCLQREVLRGRGPQAGQHRLPDPARLAQQLGLDRVQEPAGHLCGRRGQVPRLRHQPHRHRQDDGQAAGDRGVRPGPRRTAPSRRAGPTTDRDRFYRMMFGLVEADMKAGGPLAGTNFWAWNGEGRAQHPDAWFKMGDRSYVGDPPQEEQGLFGVFDADASTLAVVREHAKAVSVDLSPSPRGRGGGGGGGRGEDPQKVDVTGVMIRGSDSAEREPNRVGGSSWTIPKSIVAA